MLPLGLSALQHRQSLLLPDNPIRLATARTRAVKDYYISSAASTFHSLVVHPMVVTANYDDMRKTPQDGMMIGVGAGQQSRPELCS